MGRILKSCMWFILRFLTAMILILLSMGVMGFLVTMAGGQEASLRFMALTVTPVLPIFFACFAANNTIKVRAWAALRSIFVTSVLAAIWGAFQPAISPTDISAVMSQQYAVMVFMYLAGVLSVIWTPSLAIRGSKPQPLELYKFEKLFVGACLLFCVYGYVIFDTSLKMIGDSPDVSAEQLQLIIEMMNDMKTVTFISSLSFMVLFTLVLTRARFIIVRTLLLFTAVMMIPGMLLNWVMFDVRIEIILGGLISSALFIYCAWLLYKGPIANWTKEAKSEFLESKLNESS